MKKFTTKLLMSIIAVAFAFVALGTSTYAWFSMNTTVTASNMVVTAKSDSTYLLIGTSATATAVQAGNATDVDATTTDETEVYPIAYTKNGTSVTLESGTQSIPAETWYTLSNGNTDDATDELKNYATHTDLSGYVVTYTAYLCLSKDSQEPYTGKLALNYSLAANNGTTDAAVSAVVKIYNNAGTLVETSAPLQIGDANITANLSYQTTNDITINNSLTNKVEILVYIDGNSVNVYSDYINGVGETPAKVITGKAVVGFSLVD